MVQQFTPGAADLLSLGSSNSPLSPIRPQNEFHYYPVRDMPDVYTWEYIVRDLSYGLNRVWGNLQDGDAGPDSHRLQTSALDTSYPGTVVLPFLQTDLSLDTTGTGVCWTRLDGSVVFGSGSTADGSLGRYFASAPALGNQYGFVTYTPGSVIQNLANIVIGGATAAARVAVLRAGASIDILSTPGVPGISAAASAGAMNAALTNGRGIITSGLNASAPGVPVHGIYANGGLYTIPASAAIGDAPTQTATFKDGGYAIDSILLKGWPARAFWQVPGPSSASGYGNIVHTSLEFNDPQELNGVPLVGGVLHSMRHRDMLEVSDGRKNKEYDGRAWSDLGWVTDREPNSDTTYQNAGYFQLHDDLYCFSQRYDTWAGATRVAIERYDREVKQWHQTGPALAGSLVSVSDVPEWTFNPKMMPFPKGNGFPAVEESSEALAVMFNTIFSVFQAPTGYNVFNTWRQTSGAGAGTGKPFVASGTAKSAGLMMPPVPGGGHAVHVVEQVEVQGDVPAGGTTAKLQVQLATQTATGFSFSNNLKAQVVTADRLMRDPTRFLDNEAYFTRLAYQLYLERDGTNTRQTPNGLPIIFRGITYARGAKPRSPRVFWRDVGQSNGRKVV